MKKKIFISYSRKDKEVVLPLVQSVEKTVGEICWVDYDGIESGTRFDDTIIKAIGSSQLVLLMVSVNALESTYVKKEIDYALGEGKIVIPVILDKEGFKEWIKFEFLKVDYIDIHDPLQCKKLKDHLSKLFGGTDVFICHSIHDNRIVCKLRDLFDANSISYYDDKQAIIDCEGLDPDTILHKKIYKAKVIVYLSSEHANNSENVKSELRYAMRCHKRLLTLKLDTTPCPEEFNSFFFMFPKIDSTFYNLSVEKELVERILIIKDGKKAE